MKNAWLVLAGLLVVAGPARADGRDTASGARRAVPAPVSMMAVPDAENEAAEPARPATVPDAAPARVPAPAPSAAPIPAAAEVAAARDGLSLEGVTGWLRVASPRRARPGELRLGLAATYYETDSYPISGTWASQGTGRLAGSYSVDGHWEIYGALRSLATSTSATVPKLVQAQGDFLLGGRGAWNPAAAIGLGADLRVFVPAGTGGLLPAFGAPAVTLRGLLGWDAARTVSSLKVPLDLAVNLGATWDRTGELATAASSPAADYASAIVRHPHFSGGFAIATRLAGFEPFLEFSADVPVGVDDAALKKATASVSSIFGAAAWRLAPGLRWTASSGASLGAAVEIGLGNRVAIPGFASAPPVNFVVSLGWATDVGRPPPVVAQAPAPAPCPAPAAAAPAAAPSAPDFLLPSIEPSAVTGSVTGKVSAADGSPVAGAIVAMGPGLPRAATDETGSFAARELAPGAFELQASAPGFVAGRAKVSVEAGKAAAVQVTLEREPPPAPKTALLLALVDAAGRPVAGRVTLTGPKTLDGTAPASGVLRFDSIAAGTWTMLATSPVHFAARRELKLQAGGTGLQVVVLAARPAAPSVAVDEARGRLVLAKPLGFEEKKPAFAPGNDAVLDEIADAMVSGPWKKLHIVAHVEKAGRPIDAKRLTEARAKTVADALVARGVPAAWIETAGKGFDEPLMPGASPRARQANRRVELLVSR